MKTKIKFRSHYIFTMFLAGSLCGLANYMQADPDELFDDQAEEPTHRIQMAGALQQTITAIDNAVTILNGGNSSITLSTIQDNGVAAGTVIEGGTSFTPSTDDLTSISRALSAIEGAGFVSSTDSLKVISDVVNDLNIDLDGVATLANQTTQGLVALATNAQAVAILEAVEDINIELDDVASLAIQTTQGTVALATLAQANDILSNNGSPEIITGGTSFLTGTNNLSSVATALRTIEGTGFATATDSLFAISTDIGTPANTGAGADTLAGILGDPGAQTISASTSISAALGAIQGTSFATGTDSLRAISVDIGAPANDSGTATIAGILGNPGAVTGGAATIAGVLGDPQVSGVNSTLALVLGDPQVSTGSASISAAIGDLTNAGATATIAGILGDPTASTAETSISASLGAIEGATFTSDASLAALAGLDVPAGTVIVGGTTYTANTNDLTSLSLGLAYMEGAGFVTATDSLRAISVDIGAPANDSGTATIAGILGNPGAVTGGAATIAGVLGDPQVNAVNSTLAGVLGDPNDVAGATSISNALDLMAGATFVTGTDSLEAISNTLAVSTSSIEGTNAFGIVIAGGDAAYTNNTNDLTALSQGLSSIKGTLFDPATDSLKIISDNLAVVDGVVDSTLANTVEILGQDVPAGTVIVGGTTYTANTNDLTSISRGLSAMEGAGFASGTNGLAFLATAANLATVSGNVDDIETAVGILGNGTTTMTGLYLATKGTNVDGTTTAVTGGATYTTNTNNLSSVSKSLSAIEGATFDTTTDSLAVISAAQAVQGVGPFATAANLATMQIDVSAILVDTGTDIPATLATLATAANLATVSGNVDDIEAAVGILGNGTTTMTGLYLATKGTNVDGTTTAVTGGATYTTNTNNLSSVSKSLSAIEGATFDTTTDSLAVISAAQAVQGVGPFATAANLATMQIDVSAILVDTGTDIPATLATLATAANLATVSGNVDDIETAVGILGNGTTTMTGLYLATKGTNVDGTTTAVTGGATYTTNTNNLSSVSKSLSAIEGATFDTTTDSLAVISAAQAVQGVGPFATAANLATMQIDVSAILVDTAVIGTAVNTAGTATIGGVLGDPNDVAGATSISNALDLMAGATFATGTDSLEAISNNLISVPFATSAQVGTLVNTAGTATIGGVLGDPNDVAGATSISNALDLMAGATFATGTDSLEAISDALAVVDTNVDDIEARLGTPTAGTVASNIGVLGDGSTTMTGLYAQTVGILGADVPAGTALTPGATYTANTNDLTSMSLALSTIEGTGFTSALATLFIISRQIALGQVIAAASSPALQLPVVNGDATDDTFNASMVVVFDNLVLALVTPANAIITTLNGNLDTAVTDAAALAALTSAYPKSAVQAAVQSLETAVDSWLAFYPA